MMRDDWIDALIELCDFLTGLQDEPDIILLINRRII